MATCRLFLTCKELYSTGRLLEAMLILDHLHFCLHMHLPSNPWMSWCVCHSVHVYPCFVTSACNTLVLVKLYVCCICSLCNTLVLVSHTHTHTHTPCNVSKIGNHPSKIDEEGASARELRQIYTFPIRSCALYVSWSINLQKGEGTNISYIEGQSIIIASTNLSLEFGVRALHALPTSTVKVV